MQFNPFSARSDSTITIQVASGHFATNHSHINLYLDMTQIKSNLQMARKAATLLADQYSTTQVETILCMEGTNMLGAFMAAALSQNALFNINGGADISVLTPELNSNNQMIFRDNTQGLVRDRSIVLLLSSVSTGKTVRRTLDCLSYYGGRLAGVCALFSAIRDVDGQPVYSIFSEQDLPHYRTFIPNQCEMCGSGERITAIVNDHGFVVV